MIKPELFSPALEQYMIAMRRELHQCPEVGFDLPQTTAIIKRELCAMGIAQLTRTLGREWGKEGGVRINCIAPGTIETPENHALYSDPVVLKEMCDKLPLSHRGVVKNIADAALFLASDDASYITGVTLYVDGGLSLVQG